MVAGMDLGIRRHFLFSSLFWPLEPMQDEQITHYQLRLKKWEPMLLLILTSGIFCTEFEFFLFHTGHEFI